MSQRRSRRQGRQLRAPIWRRRGTYVGLGALTLALVAAILILRLLLPGTASGAVPCSAGELSVEHVHAHLAITIRGQARAVPANIGIRSSCFFWLHTHDVSGVIHVEAGNSETYTLGQFFDVWGEPLMSDGMLGERAGAGEELRAYVNDQQWTGNPRAIPLTAHERIFLVIGPPFPPPPPYTFAPGL